MSWPTSSSAPPPSLGSTPASPISPPRLACRPWASTAARTRRSRESTARRGRATSARLAVLLTSPKCSKPLHENAVHDRVAPCAAAHPAAPLVAQPPRARLSGRRRGAFRLLQRLAAGEGRLGARRVGGRSARRRAAGAGAQGSTP